MEGLGRSVAKTRLSPLVWSLLGLFFAFLSAFFYSLPMYYSLLLGGAFLLISGFTDIIDGMVARLTGKVSDRGSFLDSNFDRIAEIAVFSGMVYGKKVDPFLAIITLSLSLLVSYSRAKGEALSIKMMGVGFGERAERIILLALFSFLSLINFELLNLGLLIILVLSALTFLQRVKHILKSLP